MEFIHENILSNPNVRRYGIPIAGTLIGLRTLWFLNSWASQRALNHYTPNSKWDWSKELVVITGGSSGIGAAIVKQLASDGVKVIVIDINEPTTPTPSNVHFYQTDLSSPPAISSTVTQIHETHGHPTVLINNAGIAGDDTILDLSLEYIQKTFAVNHFSHYALIKAFVPAMIARKHGHVVTVASMAAFAVRAANVAYAASKAASLQLHDGLSQELVLYYDAPGVRTTIVHPGWVNTPLLTSLLENGLNVSMTEPEEIADAVVKQLYSGNSGALYLPRPIMGIAVGMKSWPHWVQENFRIIFSRTTMDAATKSAKAGKRRAV